MYDLRLQIVPKKSPCWTGVRFVNYRSNDNYYQVIIIDYVHVFNTLAFSVQAT